MRMTLRMATQETLTLIAALVLGVVWTSCDKGPSSPDADSQNRANALNQFVQEAGKSPVFTNAMTQDPKQGGSATETAEACLAPEKWRSLHRVHRYQAVLLTGPVWAYEPLLRHLVASPDWKLAMVDDTGFVFFPAFEGEKKFTSGEPDTLFPDASDPSIRARRLAALAENLALADVEDYQNILAHARELAPLDPVVLSHAAAIHIRTKDWPAAEKSARLALEQNPRFSTARYLLIQALLNRGRSDEAYEESRQLLSLESRDIPILFLHARVAHAARAFQDEAATLEKLISLCRQRGVPEGGYRVYLGQAYAKLGKGPQAIEQFELALQSPLIDEPSKARIRETLEMVRSRRSLR